MNEFSNDNRGGTGTLTVIAGPMFSGKSARLLEIVKGFAVHEKIVAVFTHAIDTRRGIGDISTHDGRSIPAIPVTQARDILPFAEVAEAVAVDEAQFFGAELMNVVDALLDRGVDVVVCGLSVTFDGRPFSPIPELMAVAERVEKLTADCSVCVAPASFHQPASNQDLGDPLEIDERQVGGAKAYEARCRRHATRQ